MQSWNIAVQQVLPPGTLGLPEIMAYRMEQPYAICEIQKIPFRSPKKRHRQANTWARGPGERGR